MTRYRIRLDRDACEGIFACLVRDDRFVEADDGLATVADADGHREADGDGPATVAGAGTEAGDGDTGADRVLTVDCDDDRLDDARGAAAACPVDAIAVEVRE
jgi:ferredoxin